MEFVFIILIVVALVVFFAVSAKQNTKNDPNKAKK
jgi:hypothetical protein